MLKYFKKDTDILSSDSDISSLFYISQGYVEIGDVEFNLFLNKEISIQRISELKEMLSSSDWKVIVNNELINMGLQPKYNMSELHTQRQNWRDEINTLEDFINV